MTWKIRHEGSPRMIEGLGLPQVVEGLQDGLWEPTDEVMGPNDRDWVAIESHPQLAHLIEEPPEPPHEEETHIDMNPMIDVALVLLIFFILTTSYSLMQRIIEMPTLSTKGPQGALVVSKKKHDEVMIKVTAKQNAGGGLSLAVEDQPVKLEEVGPALKRFVSGTHKTQISIDAQGVTWGTVVAIQDAAKGAGIERVHVVIHQPQPGQAPPG